MKKSLIAFTIISLLAAPKVMADEVSTQTQTQVGINGPSKSQEELHESEEAKIHENEPFDESGSPIPSSSPTVSPTPTGSPAATITPTPSASPIGSATPSVSPTPSGSPTVTAGVNIETNLFEKLSGILKDLMSLLKISR